MVVGSNPTATTICEGVAQLAEHLTFNQVVESSNLSILTIFWAGSLTGKAMD